MEINCDWMGHLLFYILVTAQQIMWGKTHWEGSVISNNKFSCWMGVDLTVWDTNSLWNISRFEICWFKPYALSSDWPGSDKFNSTISVINLLLDPAFTEIGVELSFGLAGLALCPQMCVVCWVFWCSWSFLVWKVVKTGRMQESDSAVREWEFPVCSVLALVCGFLGVSLQLYMCIRLPKEY